MGFSKNIEAVFVIAIVFIVYPKPFYKVSPCDDVCQ